MVSEDEVGITFKPKRTSPPKDSSSSSSSEGTSIEVRQGKQIISESELMRRRRLLDSYIF